jgi:hypothetical protein
MKPDLRKLVRFVLALIPLLVLSLALYRMVLRVYPPVVHKVANLVTERLSPPSRIVFDRGGYWRAYSIRPDGTHRRLHEWGRNLHTIYISLVTLPALLLATPTGLVARFRLLGIGLALLAAVHVLAVIGLMRGFVCLDRTQGAFICNWLLRAVYTSGQVVPFVLWILLTWRCWFRRPEPSAPA